jgi:hypothetical protein
MGMKKNYEIYYRKKGTKRWLRSGQTYITLKAGMADKKWMQDTIRMKNYEFQIRGIK